MANTETNHDMEQSILKVAEQLFLDKGFNRTSTTEIARVVGCNQTLIHYYFRTKENLFNRIFEKKLEQIIPQLFELSQQKVSRKNTTSYRNPFFYLTTKSETTENDLERTRH